MKIILTQRKLLYIEEITKNKNNLNKISSNYAIFQKKFPFLKYNIKENENVLLFRMFFL